MTLLLDGVRLARERAAELATRGASVRERRGNPPRLVLIAFAESDGRAPHVERKIRASSAAGVCVLPVILDAGVATAAARDAIARASVGADGVFLQFPFPAAIDAEALTAAIEELARRGARMGDVLAPDDAHASAVLNDAGLVIVSVGKPGAVDATVLAKGAVAIDVGYFNPGGRGDIRGDTSHLSARAPVPGGIGPMTVSMLIERTILYAERNATGRRAEGG